MLSNLPPGVTESMIPGNRPEDQEFEFNIVLTKGEIENLTVYALSNTPPNRNMIFWEIVCNILNQIEEQIISK